MANGKNDLPARGGQGKGKNSGAGRMLRGQVGNLEENVQSDWWRYIFNSIYMKTDGDVVEDNRLTNYEVDYFSSLLNLNKDDHILDLCCGQGRHTLELARRGFSNIVGLDRSHYLIQKARSRSKKENLAVRFREGDARKLPLAADTFDVVMILGNSIGYFETMQDDMRVLTEVLRVLKPWGRILLDVADGAFLRHNFQPRSWEWINNNLFVCRERSLSVDDQRLVSREVVTHVDKGVIADQFYAERLYTEESMSNLLKTSGFSSIECHGTIKSDSERNQDLGMMERRMILTAQVKKEWSKSRAKKKAVRNVVVLLGDPRKSDPLKPQSVFDDDDFYTIDQMKDALRNLGEYSFKYLDNHDTFIHDLSDLKGKIDLVFNLCDEGYNNNPRLELHVPSLLESLNIPFTGAGPQCLAICYDKSLTRGLAKEMEIPVPEAFIIKPEDTIMEIPFGFPVIVKPNFGDSSFGITQRSIAYNVNELENAIKEIKDKFGYGKPILVEEFLTGADISVGIIGNPPESYSVLPVIEEDYSALPPELPKLCGYEAKWMPESPYYQIHSVPANLPDETEKFVVACCLRLFERLECRDYSRFDWRLDSQGNPKLLEVNPNPGWCWDGHLAKMGHIQDMSYRDMLSAILGSAEQRYGLAQDQAGHGENEITGLLEVS